MAILKSNRSNAFFVGNPVEQAAGEGDWVQFKPKVQSQHLPIEVNSGTSTNVLLTGKPTEEPLSGDVILVKETGNNAIHSHSFNTSTDQAIKETYEINSLYSSEQKDIAGLTNSFSVGAQEPRPDGLALSPDGTKMFVVGNTNAIYQYSLAKPWDMSTASYDSSFFDIQSFVTDPSDIALSSAGDKIFVVGNFFEASEVYEITLSTPWDLSTANYSGVNYILFMQETQPRSISFSSSGTEMYIVGLGSIIVYQYSLSSAWDVSTAYYSSISFDPRTTIGPVSNAAFSVDGSKMFLSKFDRSIHQFTLDTPWNVGTASYDNVSYDMPKGDGFSINLTFSHDGNKLFIIDSFRGFVYEYTLSIPWYLGKNIYDNVQFNVSTVGFDVWSSDFSPDGTRMFVTGSGSIRQYDLANPWNLSSASYTGNSRNVALDDTTQYSLEFSPTGNKMFILGGQNDAVLQYTLTTPWDILTATYDGVSFGLSAQDSTPRAIEFSPNGTKMFMIGTSGIVFQYSLGTPWDAGTTSYDIVSFTLSAPVTLPEDLSFSADGYKMFILGDGKVSVYSLGTAWDVGTASYNGIKYHVDDIDRSPVSLEFSASGSRMFIIGAFGENSVDFIHQFSLPKPYGIPNFSGNHTGITYDVSTESPFPKSLTFSADGSKMYTLHGFDGTSYQYSLSTPWDIGTLTYDNVRFDAPAALNNVFEMELSDDGSKMYILSGNSNTVYQYSLSTPWDIGTSTYDNVSFDVSPQTSLPKLILFSQDGSRMYVLGQVNPFIFEYSLSTRWHISTASYSTGKSVGNLFFVDGFYISPDGTKMFILTSIDGRVYKYTLSDAWDVSTASYDGIRYSVKSDAGTVFIKDMTFSRNGDKMFILEDSDNLVHQYTYPSLFGVPNFLGGYTGVKFGVGSEEIDPQTFAFSTKGDKMFVLGLNNREVHQYSLASYFDISTATYDTASFSINTETSFPQGLAFSSDGSKMFVVEGNSGSVLEYHLSTSWDVSTASLSGTSISVVNGGVLPEDLAFSQNGSKMFILTYDKKVHQYTLSTPWDVSTRSYDNVEFDMSSQNTIPKSMSFTSDGKQMVVIGPNDDTAHHYSLEDPWNISTASYSSAKIYVRDQDTISNAVRISTDGSKMFILGESGREVNEYILPSSFNILGSVNRYTGDSFRLVDQDQTGRGFTFSYDGSKMYYIGLSNKTIYQYSLSTPWSISTASYDNISLSVSARGNFPEDLVFSTDGSKMFFLERSSNKIFQYSLSTSWDLSTATYDGSGFDASSQEILPTCLEFSSDGTKMYVLGTWSDAVYQYSLAVPWDIGTTTYTNNSYSIGFLESLASGLAFSEDGTKMFVVGTNTDTIYQLNLGTPWDVTTSSWNKFKLDVSAQDTDPNGVRFSLDGTKMFVLGGSVGKRPTVYEYSVGEISVELDISALSLTNPPEHAMLEHTTQVKTAADTTPENALFKMDTSPVTHTVDTRQYLNNGFIESVYNMISTADSRAFVYYLGNQDKGTVIKQLNYDLWRKS